MAGNPNPKHKFAKNNEYGNRDGNKSKVRITKSPLRKTADSLREVEQDALITIKAAVKGEEVDKVQLDTSKWVINTIQQLDKSASAEEVSSAKIRLEAKLAAEAGAGVDDVHNADVSEMPKRLSLVYQEPEDDE